MIRLAPVAAAALLAACQTTTGTAPEPAPPAEPAEPADTGPGFVYLVPKTGAPARDMIERLAAQCWLDGVARGAALVVDRQSGRVIVVSDTDEILIAENIGLDGAKTRWRLSGPVAEDPAKAARLRETLDIAVQTDQTACPRLTG